MGKSMYYQRTTSSVTDVDFTVGAEAGNVINVGVKLNTAGSVFAYISDNADGSTVAGTAPDTVAIGTDGLAIPLVAGKAFQLVSEADGDIDINITEVGADTWYLVVVLSTGEIRVSGAITFTT
jgi:hypothetical protein